VTSREFISWSDTFLNPVVFWFKIKVSEDTLCNPEDADSMFSGTVVLQPDYYTVEQPQGKFKCQARRCNILFKWCEIIIIFL
jgi:hypothetical protein